MTKQNHSIDEPDIYDLDSQFYDHITEYRNRRDVAFFVEEALNSNGQVL